MVKSLRVHARWFLKAIWLGMKLFIFHYITGCLKLMCKGVWDLGKSSKKKKTLQNISRGGHYVKCIRIRSFSGRYFSTFRLNTERYRVSLGIQSKCGKIRTRKTTNTDTFHAVDDKHPANPAQQRTESRLMNTFRNLNRLGSDKPPSKILWMEK